jgi:hypothetical protein
MLEMKRDEIDKVFQDGMNGKLEQDKSRIISMTFCKPFHLYWFRAIPPFCRQSIGFQKCLISTVGKFLICEYTHHAQTGLFKCQECSPFIENDDMKEEANSKLIINK